MSRLPYVYFKKGFTIIEVTVVLAVFFLIIGATVSLFISIIQHQKRILSEQELLNQVGYMTEYVSRGLRTAVKDPKGNCLLGGQSKHPGYIYYLTHYDPNTGFYSGVKFITSDGVCKEVFLDVDGIIKEIKNGGAAQSILSSKFQVAYYRFAINGDKGLSGSPGKDFVQPRITMILDILTNIGGNQQEKIFQTTVSQRNLNPEVPLSQQQQI